MKAPADCRLIGRWRIVEADLWDRALPSTSAVRATLTVTAQGGVKSPLEPWRLVSMSNTPATRPASAGPDATKATRSEAKETPNSSTTARSKSNSPTTTATKPSSKQNETLLQRPALMFAVNGFARSLSVWLCPGA